VRASGGGRPATQWPIRSRALLVVSEARLVVGEEDLGNKIAPGTHAGFGEYALQRIASRRAIDPIKYDRLARIKQRIGIARALALRPKLDWAKVGITVPAGSAPAPSDGGLRYHTVARYLTRRLFFSLFVLWGATPPPPVSRDRAGAHAAGAPRRQGHDKTLSSSTAGSLNGWTGDHRDPSGLTTSRSSLSRQPTGSGTRL
jgi:hypothetical protein